MTALRRPCRPLLSQALLCGGFESGLLLQLTVRILHPPRSPLLLLRDLDGGIGRGLLLSEVLRNNWAAGRRIPVLASNPWPPTHPAILLFYKTLGCIYAANRMPYASARTCSAKKKNLENKTDPVFAFGPTAVLRLHLANQLNALSPSGFKLLLTMDAGLQYYTP